MPPCMVGIGCHDRMSQAKRVVLNWSDSNLVLPDSGGAATVLQNRQGWVLRISPADGFNHHVPTLKPNDGP